MKLTVRDIIATEACVDQSGFMHKYYDWAAFEEFVRDLHAEDGDVVVLHNITETDRYGAKRQIDVKIVRRTPLYSYTTLVECKRWKERVGRDRIDVLAASVEALGAQKGAVFTTTGFEEGAVAYAKGKGIELYRVRDLTSDEWGLPGRRLSLQLHLSVAEIKNICFQAQATPLVDDPPSELNISIEISADHLLDPTLDLFSVKSGERGPNLVGVMGDAHRTLLSAISGSSHGANWVQNGTLQIDSQCELDLSKTEFCQLRLQKMAVRIEKIGFVFCAQISHSLIDIDRGANLDFAVMIENFVSEQRLIAHRRTGEQNVKVQQPMSRNDPASPSDEVLRDGSILRITCSPWTGLGNSVASERAIIESLLRVVVETRGKTPLLTLQVVSLPEAR